jgi:methylenetetrahydrofolate--tRNA-(uracil-5-)-methyltransferase
MREDIVIIGGGLAGSEAAWQAANRGAKVTLYEMRPKEQTAAHKTGYLAELVCSNSLGSTEIQSAPGILKEEMRRLGSLIIKTADEVRVPAGAALAVDRDLFAQKITQTLEGHPNIRILHEPVTEIPPDCAAIVATGPLTTDALAEHLKNLTHAKHLYFYDAISPIVDADSIDMSVVFRASRYDKGSDYLNCPMTEAEYDAFYTALLEAEKVVPKDFEQVPYFEGCIPIEVMAERGRDTMMFGPMKPVGLVDPKTNARPYAVVQLRMENRHGTCYNLVGFQTKLTYGAQKRVLRMIPGLQHAEFLRYGSVHRNTFVNAPTLLRDTLQLKSTGRVFLAGQLVGVEGYTEAAATGGLAGLNAARGLIGKDLAVPPETTAHGALLKYITTSDPRHFQPINTNYGLFPPLPSPIRDKQERQRQIGQRALEDFAAWMQRSGLS